jgi:hypothetical protein
MESLIRTLLTLLIGLAVVGLILWGLSVVVAWLALPAPIVTVIWVVVAVVVILAVARAFGLLGGPPLV